MRLDPRLRLARAGSSCSRGSASCPTRCVPAEIDETPLKGELPRAYARADGRRKGGGGRRARTRSCSPPTRWSRSGGASCPRPRTRRKRGPAWRCSPAAATASFRAVALVDAEGTRPPSAVDIDRRVQAPERRGDRRLSRQRRVARQGRRLCDPGPRRGAGPHRRGLPFRRRRPAAVRDARAARAPPATRLAEWLYEEGIGEDRAILVEDGEIVEAAIELPGALRAGAVVDGAAGRICCPAGAASSRSTRRRGADRAAAGRR